MNNSDSPILSQLTPNLYLTLITLYRKRRMTGHKAAIKLGITRRALGERLRRIRRKAGVATTAELARKLSSQEWQQIMNPEITAPRKLRRNEGPQEWKHTYAAMNKAQRAQLADRIRQDAEEISQRLGCENRLLSILYP